MSDIPFHDAANIFPLMTGDDFDQLVEDIRKHGLREPVAMLDEKILDGRNRYRACLLARVECQFETIETDDPVAYVVSLNKHRRQMTPSQLATVADKVRAYYDKQAKERQKLSEGRGKKGPVKLPDLKGDARDAAGKAVGVSGKLVDNARVVREKGVPELYEAVEQGRMSVTRAAELTERDEKEQREMAEQATATGGRYRNQHPKTEPEETPRDTSKSVAISRGNEAINALKRIPINDPLRKRGFQIVTDWIRVHK